MKRRTDKRQRGGRQVLLVALVLGVAGLARTLHAQQQYAGLCAYVKIEILQELTLERIGFLATLEVTNNDADDPITGFTAALRFSKPRSDGTAEDASDRFWVRDPELLNISGVGGDGAIAPGATATVKWFIVPKTGAGGQSPGGVYYYVSCNLAGKIRGETIPEDVMFALPDMIQVKPEPELAITYFQPRDVQGDDPYTAQVEAPVPFTLGVLVKNVGYGKANSVVIRSSQPRIIENKQLLLLVAQLTGCRVMDEPLDQTSLTVNLGDLEPGQARVGAWDMIASISGTFTNVTATYTHALEFGGEATSLIRSLNAHFIAHEVLDDRVGRDRVRDFLADTDRDADQIPDTLYTSGGDQIPVNSVVSNAQVVASSRQGLTIAATPIVDGATYIRVSDPGQNKRKLARVLRADGTQVNTNNAWTSTRYLKQGNTRLDEFHLFDFVTAGDQTYTVEYAESAADTTPPATTLEFSGAWSVSEGVYYIAPETQVYFLSTDESPVSITYRLTESMESWVPAYPFTLALGAHTVLYRATDSAGNAEAVHTNTVVVLNPAATEAAVSLTLDQSSLSLLSDLVSARSGLVNIGLGATDSTLPLPGCVEVFAGVRAWPQLSGLPATPVRPGTFTLSVSGQDADNYRYRVNDGAWSDEHPVSEPFSVEATSPGTYSVDVLARASCDVYPEAAEALRGTWTVADDAPLAVLTEAPPYPNTRTTARFTVAGPDVSSFRWSVNTNYLHASLAAGSSFSLSNLTDRAYDVRIFPNLPDGVHADTGYQAYVWQNALTYGYAVNSGACVRRFAIGDARNGGSLTWDGTDNQGTQVVPGWYTLRASVSNALGQLMWTKARVHVEEVGASDREIASGQSGVQAVRGRGAYAVWADRSGAHQQIYVRNLSDGGTPLAITDAARTQDNPSTDGRYVVWQGRQSDSTWAVYGCDLQATQRIVWVISALPDVDETKPVIDWPWVVWQTADVRTAHAPSQLYATNLVTGVFRRVSPTSQDQLAACVNNDRVVWQDWRDAGAGEIYYQDLETGEERRLTANTAGQYNPVMDGALVVWQDNRDGNLELYASDLRNGRETRLTATAYDEARPVLTGDWLLYLENSLGAEVENLRLMHVPSRRTAPLTRSQVGKSSPALLSQYAVWVETTNTAGRIVAGALPALRAVYAERNAVPVTRQMVERFTDAFTLIRLWSEQIQVNEILVYDQLWPEVVSRRAYRTSEGAASGENFALAEGQYLWMSFARPEWVDFGSPSSGSLTLPAGVSVVTYTDFPVGYHAFQMARDLGLEKLHAVRMYEAATGRWLTMEVKGGRLVGKDFPIPRIAVLYFDMVEAVVSWKPE